MSTEDKGVAAVTPNNRYNVMGVIYHALQGGQSRWFPRVWRRIGSVDYGVCGGDAS
jgi:hypothetical protein